MYACATNCRLIRHRVDQAQTCFRVELAAARISFWSNSRRQPNARDDLIENIWLRNSFFVLLSVSSFIVHYTIAIDWLCSHPEAEQRGDLLSKCLWFIITLSACVFRMSGSLGFDMVSISDRRRLFRLLLKAPSECFRCANNKNFSSSPCLIRFSPKA